MMKKLLFTLICGFAGFSIWAQERFMKNKNKINKTIIFGISCFVLVSLNINAHSSNIKFDKNSRQRILFDESWKFNQGDISGAENIDFNDESWRLLTLPHDWSIEGEYDEHASTGGSGGYLPTGIGWYRKHFNISKGSQNCWIEFDGVYMNSEVWINGNYLGKHANGYISFYYDITPYLKDGENVIAVKVDNSIQTNSRWYSGSGIYRHVWLNVANPLHISQWGTYVTTPFVDSLSATVCIKTIVENNYSEVKNAVLSSRIVDSQGKVVVETKNSIIVNTGEKKEFTQFVNVNNPSLWSVDFPSMYTLNSSITVNGKIVDNFETPFGIRSIEFDAMKGFLLNGEQVKMNGVCLHHDAGCFGAAVPVQVWERRFKILKEMGCNAIRTSHNAMAPEFMDLCDRMGFLVMDEPFDEWEEAKGNTTSAYHLYFKENWENDLISFIHRDRNHPSVVIWSAGNEIPEQSTTRGQEVLKQLLDVFHREGPTRPVTTANDRIEDDGRAALLPFLEMEDVVGYNYVDRWHERREQYYSIDKINHPDWIMIGTENVSVRGDRGAYSLDGKNNNKHGLAYNNGMIRAEQLWKFTATRDYVCGDFMWTGIDYLGESRWPRKGSDAGVIDMAGFPKDGYYFYQSQWTDNPMIHILPHWNWAGIEGEIIPVIAYSNCDAVELFVNGKSYGEQKLEFPRPGNSGGWNTYDKPPINGNTADLHLTWNIPYEPGTLKAVGKRDGEIVYTSTVTTAGAPAALRLSVDKNSITANGYDIVHSKVEIVDAYGVVVPEADNEIQFEVRGEGKLIGIENGNQSDLTSPTSKIKKAFNGLILGYIQSNEKPGNINIKASSTGLKDSEITITVVESNKK
ncbi:sugar-binding domain-containing protein [Sunxiuqinia sp. A32]|uniref:sugar-binding domain-containing protein n=1 Tax=Sunxiuqinia sp. A32 TaxID=3461496 RepID=UPI004045AFB0